MNNKTIDKYLEKIGKSDYGYYYDDYKVALKTPVLNCYDEICEGSHDRGLKVQGLLTQKIEIGSEGFMEKLGDIIYELHGLMKEEMMALNDWTEHEANLWIDGHINFMHMKMHEINGKKYLSVAPEIVDK